MSDTKRGLYGKFHVTTPDGAPVDARLFILRPERDPHAATVAAAFPEVLARFRGRYRVTKTRVEGWCISSGECADAVALDAGDAHVRVVLSAYAAAVEGDNPALAADLRAMAGS